MIGDTSVGKTALMKRFITGNYSEQYISTLGIELFKKNVKIKNENYMYRIWDTCGQEKFRSLTKSYYQQADGIMLLFDLNNIDSFNNLTLWFNSIEESNCKDIPIVIVGTKCDLECSISDELINNLENKDFKNVTSKVFKCSAKDNIGV